MKKTTKGHLLYYTGLAVSILAPLITAATQFPVWTEKVGGTQVGGMFILVAIICMIPLYKHLNISLKSPSSLSIWLTLSLILWALSKVVDQLLIVCVAGLIGNAVGLLLCAIGNKLRYGKWLTTETLKEVLNEQNTNR